MPTPFLTHIAMCRPAQVEDFGTSSVSISGWQGVLLCHPARTMSTKKIRRLALRSGAPPPLLHGRLG